jgi:hypothetical protein
MTHYALIDKQVLTFDYLPIQMCEFCSNPADFNNRNNRDSTHSDFAGFFSAVAIEAAVRQSHATRTKPEGDTSTDDGGDDDDDGT